MLSYAQFEEKIEIIKEYIQKEDELTRIFNCEGFINYSERAIESIVDLLEEIMEDQEHQWIEYWMWECNFGKDGADKVFIEDKPVPFTTIKDLYFMLLKGRQENNENSSN